MLKRASRAIIGRFPLFFLAGLTASGWLPRAARWPVLGASLLGFAGLSGNQKWPARKNRALMGSQLEPVFRWTQELLAMSHQEKAGALRLRENGTAIEIFYRINGQWRESSALPVEMWLSLRHLLLRYARQGEFQSSETAGGISRTSTFRIAATRAHLDFSASGETLEFEFENAAPIASDSLPEPLPDVRCRCHELNAPDAVWCWNCGAPLESARISRWKSVAESVAQSGAMVLILGALGSSGWCSRRARPLALGAGLSGVALAFAWGCWQSRQRKSQSEAPLVEAPVEVWIKRVWERAGQTQSARIVLRERGGVIVSFAGAEESGETLNLPVYVWLALRGCLLQIARGGICEINGHKRHLSAELRSDVGGETLELVIGDVA